MEKDKLYCGRHYNDLFKARCKACDESIMEANFVKAEGASWHTKHFCCQSCDLNLAGKRYVCSNFGSFPSLVLGLEGPLSIAWRNSMRV